MLAKRFVDSLKQYVDALLLCGSVDASDWEQARKKLELLGPFFVFTEDPDLIRRFRAGDEAARRELARRGQILRALGIFREHYDRDRWEEARKTLVEAGEPGQILLAVSLLQILMDGQYQPVWIHARYQLVAAGKVALDTAVGLARRLAADFPENTPIFKQDDLVQVLQVVIGFGDAGRPFVEECARHPKSTVRRSAVRALGEAQDGMGGAILARLVAGDPEWTVRAAAADAMSRMAAVRAQAGAALADRIGKEKDPLVLRLVVQSIGTLGYEEGIPSLVAALEVPNVPVAERAMVSLGRLTGQRLTRPEQWVEWYRTKYPEWKARQPKRPG